MLPYPSLSPRVCSDSCPSQWCYLAISSSATPISFALIFPSIKVFSSESVLHIRWTNYWSFSFCVSPFNEYSEMICFRIDWFDLLNVQGTRKSLFQNHNSKTSILWCSAFFMVQVSHQYLICSSNKIIWNNLPLSLLILCFGQYSLPGALYWIFHFSYCILEFQQFCLVSFCVFCFSVYVLLKWAQCFLFFN